MNLVPNRNRNRNWNQDPSAAVEQRAWRKRVRMIPGYRAFGLESKSLDRVGAANAIQQQCAMNRKTGQKPMKLTKMEKRTIELKQCGSRVGSVPENGKK